MLEFVHVSGQAAGKDLQTRRKVRSQAMRDFRRRQRADREAANESDKTKPSKAPCCSKGSTSSWDSRKEPSPTHTTATRTTATPPQHRHKHRSTSPPKPANPLFDNNDDLTTNTTLPTPHPPIHALHLHPTYPINLNLNLPYPLPLEDQPHDHLPQPTPPQPLYLSPSPQPFSSSNSHYTQAFPRSSSPWTPPCNEDFLAADYSSSSSSSAAAAAAAAASVNQILGFCKSCAELTTNMEFCDSCAMNFLAGLLEGEGWVSGGLS